MATLTGCLKAAKLLTEEKAAIRAAQADYVKDGMQARGAADIAAANDALDEAYAERAELTKQIEALGGVVPEPAERWTAPTPQAEAPIQPEAPVKEEAPTYPLSEERLEPEEDAGVRDVWFGYGGDLASLPKTERAAVNRSIRALENAKEVRAALKAYQGTPWAEQAISAALTRDAMRHLMAGREPGYENPLSHPRTKRLHDLLLKGGQEGAWTYLARTGMLGKVSKPVNSINGSFLDCQPSRDCAGSCYAAKGYHYGLANHITKGELVTWAVETDPVRAAKQAAGEYKLLPEFEMQKALRIFDKGDISSAWLPFIGAINAEGVRLHIFSKRPDILRQVPDFNLKLLSVDASSINVGLDNPGMGVSFVWQGAQDNGFLDQLRPNFNAQGGVVLPIVRGSRKMAEDELKQLPNWVKRYTCPVDRGKVAIGPWSCTKCDHAGGIFCYHKQGSTAQQMEHLSRPITQYVGLDKLAEELVNATESRDLESARRLARKLRVQLAGARAGYDAGTESYQSRPADEAAERDREGRRGRRKDTGPKEPGATYELPGGRGELRAPAAGRGGPGVRQEPAPAGQAAQLDLFAHAGKPLPTGRIKQATKVKQVPVGAFKSAIDVVDDPLKAAHVLAPLRREPVESMVALVVDRHNKPIAVARHTVGGPSGSSVYQHILAGTVHSIPGASAVYLGHMHPSGVTDPSGADTRVTQAMQDRLQGTGIELREHVIIGAYGDATILHPDGSISRGNVAPAEIAGPRAIGKDVPVTMPRFRAKGKLAQPITTPDSAIQILKGIAEEQSGVLLMDNRHKPVAFIPSTVEEMAELRTGKKGTGASRIYQLIGETMPSAAMLYFPMSSFINRKAAQNMASFFGGPGADVRLLDVIEDEHSWNQTGEMPREGGAWFSRRGILTIEDTDRGRPGWSVDQVEAERDRVTKAWARKPAIRVVENYDALPVAVRDKAEAQFGAQQDSGLIDGVVVDGDIWLVAGNIRSREQLHKLIAHEAIGHVALDQVLGKHGLQALERDLAMMRKAGNKAVRQATEEVTERYGELDGRTQTREIMAVLAEKGVQNSLMQRVRAAITRFLRKLGLQIQLTTADLAMLLRASERFMTTGKQDLSPAMRSLHGLEEAPGDADLEPALSRIPQNQRGLSKMLSEGAPFDRALRAGFEMLGLPRWTKALVGQVKKTWMDRVIKAPDPNGLFGWMEPITRKANRGIIAVRAGLIDRYGQPEEYKERDWDRKLEKQGIEIKAMDMLRPLMEADTLSTEEAVVLHDILTGERSHAAGNRLENLAKPIRRALDDLGQEMVEIGYLEPQTFDRWRGKWLHRVYQQHEAGLDGISKWSANLSRKRRVKLYGEELKMRGMKYDTDQARLLRDIPPESFWGRKQRKGELDWDTLKDTKWIVLDQLAPDGEGVAALDMTDAAGQPIAGAQPRRRRTLHRVFWPEQMPIPARFESYHNRGTWEARWGAGKQKLTLWRDYSRPEREQMGQILDARYEIAKSFQILANDVANGKFFRDIALNPQWTWTGTAPPEDVAEPRDVLRDAMRTWTGTEWVKVPTSNMPGTKVPQYGALAGKYVRSEVFRDLYEIGRLSTPSWWKSIMNTFKLNKTARAPVVHMNNVMSNFMLMDMADVRLRDLARAVDQMLHKGQLYKDAQKNGVFGHGFIDQEIRNNILTPILAELKAQLSAEAETRPNGMIRVWDTFWTTIWKLDAKMIDAYRAEDEIFRMAMYINRMAKGEDAKTAAKAAQAQFLDYDIRAPWVNAARQTVLPFLAYTYRIIPLLAEMVAERPWKIAKYYIVAHMANTLAYSLWAGDAEEERRLMRDEVKGNVWIPGVPRMLRLWNDETRGPAFLDIRRWIPGGDIFDMSQSSLGFPAPLQWGGPLMIAGEIHTNTSAFTGDPIWSEEIDTWTEKWGKLGGFAWRSWMPSAPWVPGSWYFDKISRAAFGGRDMLGRDYTVPAAIFSSLGIKVSYQDKRMQTWIHQSHLQRQKRALMFELRTIEIDKKRGEYWFDSSYEADKRDLKEKLKRLEERTREIFP